MKPNIIILGLALFSNSSMSVSEYKTAFFIFRWSAGLMHPTKSLGTNTFVEKTHKILFR